MQFTRGFSGDRICQQDVLCRREVVATKPNEVVVAIYFTMMQLAGATRHLNIMRFRSDNLTLTFQKSVR